MDIKDIKVGAKISWRLDDLKRVYTIEEVTENKFMVKTKRSGTPMYYGYSGGENYILIEPAPDVKSSNNIKAKKSRLSFI